MTLLHWLSAALAAAAAVRQSDALVYMPGLKVWACAPAWACMPAEPWPMRALVLVVADAAGVCVCVFRTALALLAAPEPCAALSILRGVAGATYPEDDADVGAGADKTAPALLAAPEPCALFCT